MVETYSLHENITRHGIELIHSTRISSSHMVENLFTKIERKKNTEQIPGSTLSSVRILRLFL